MPSQHKKKTSKSVHSRNHRSTLSLQKTEIYINVYDLLPPGRVSTALWFCGSSLLHSGVVIKDKEYAYGGHDQPGMSGVYWTRPKTDPPGGRFCHEHFQGFTLKPEVEIHQAIKEVSEEFVGPSYNLLSKNCNHFTSRLCERLTNRSAPSWINRAASIGVALPCVVPREWIDAPDHDTTGGELLEEEGSNEISTMLLSSRDRQDQTRHSFGEAENRSESQPRLLHWDSQSDFGSGRNDQSKIALRDTSGRIVPASERAPTPV